MAIGGVQRGILNTLRRANRERFDYAVLCTKKEGPWGKHVRELGIPLNTQKTLPPWDPYQIWRLSRMIRKIQPDLVHVHMAPTVIPGVQAARLAGVRHIVIQHHNIYDPHWDKQNALLRSWEFRLTRGADAIIGVSEPVSECTRRRLGLSREHVTTIENGIDLEEFQQAVPHDPRGEWKIEAGRPLVMLVARYLETKRVEDFIEAAALIIKKFKGDESLKGKLPFFVVVGHGSEYLEKRYRSKIEEVGQAGGIAESIGLMGGRHDLANILPHANVGVLTSELEGCPNTLLEYLAAGVPIAATNIAPVEAIVRHGEHALLSPPRRPELLARNIETLLTNPELAQRLSGAGKEIIKNYDWQRTVRGYEAIYERVLGI